MCWCGVLDGKLIIHWFDEETSVNGHNYLEMFQGFVWSKIKHTVTSKQCFFQQDGSPPHWRTEVLEWLTSKFQDRIISHKTPRPWPAKSPDLSPLDYWSCSAAMAEVRRIQPMSLRDLKDCVEAYAISLYREQVNKAPRLYAISSFALNAVFRKMEANLNLS